MKIYDLIVDLARLMTDYGSKPTIVRLNEVTLKALSKEMFEWAQITVKDIPPEIPLVAAIGTPFGELLVVDDYFAPPGAIRVE